MMSIFRYTLIAAHCVILPMVAHAGSVDLSGWTADGGSSSWDVQPGNDTVLQTINGAPTVFYDPAVTSTQGKALSGTISVQTDGDDDFIGFVLGYQPGEIFSSTADYFLVDWKQEQPGLTPAWDAGMSISHVTNGSNGNVTFPPAPFWNHTAGEVDLITRANTLGNTGWADFTEYTFNIVFTSNLISVVVNGLQEISITPADVSGVSAFTDGAFGFYNYSQAQVLYAGITEVDCTATPDALECQPGRTIPAPATLALFALGLVGVGWSRRRNVSTAC